jgi:hypothetical protein
MRCVSACPKKQALQFSTRNGIPLSARGLLIVLLTIMFMLPLFAYVSGYWHSQTPNDIKIELIQKLDRIGH